MVTRPSRRSINRPGPRRGRPRTHREAWTKVSVVMFERQVLELDRLTNAIRSKTGANLTRAEVIRSLLDALDESRLDVTLWCQGRTSSACSRRSCRSEKTAIQYIGIS
jgi:hypothetical protein